jgi:hypothetical protein
MKKAASCVFALALASVQGWAADIVCQGDVPTESLNASERPLVDAFWLETLIYLQRYREALETPTEQCTASAEATVQTYKLGPGTAEKHCILDYPDVRLLKKQITAILAEPSKARTCFDAQKNYSTVALYTPSAQVRQLSATSKWIDRPLLTDYYRKLGGAIGAAGMELNANFVAIAGRTETRSHWLSDVSIKGLPTLWSSVGWIPMYAALPEAGSDRFRGGYLYAEIMGPWGNLRIATIDGEKVGAEIGMTVQLSNTFYPYHFHHPQEVYMTLSVPQCAGQQKHMLMDWDSEHFQSTRTANGWTVTLDGSAGESRRWFADQNSAKEWLTYSGRNAIHAFDLTGVCAHNPTPSGLVTVWARTTSRDNEQATRFCQLKRNSGIHRQSDVKATCDVHAFDTTLSAN